MTTTELSHALAGLQALVETISIEVQAADARRFTETETDLSDGSEVFVPALPEQSNAVLVQACATLRAGGFEPVPHIAARGYARAQLEELLDALATHAGVERALVVGGDIESPAPGRLASSLDALGTGLFAKYGFKRIGIAGYPDGHRWILATTLHASLDEKLRVCQLEGHEPFVVTQFSFDPASIVRWCEGFITTHPGVPVAVGMAGPARLGTLMRYAARCGVGGTLRALTTYRDTTVRLLRAATPDHELAALARLASDQPGVLHPHFFTFGGFEPTLAWRHAIAAGRIRLDSDHAGFATI